MSVGVPRVFPLPVLARTRMSNGFGLKGAGTLRVVTTKEGLMSRYLMHGTYTAEGAKGLLREGGTKRRSYIETMVKDAGGTLEVYYWAFGDTDFYAIAELPDAPSAAAIALTISGSGAVQVQTTVLLSAEEIDQATGKKVGYRPPGA